MRTDYVGELENLLRPLTFQYLDKDMLKSFTIRFTDTIKSIIEVKGSRKYGPLHTVFEKRDPLTNYNTLTEKEIGDIWLYKLNRLIFIYHWLPIMLYKYANNDRDSHVCTSIIKYIDELKELGFGYIPFMKQMYKDYFKLPLHKKYIKGRSFHGPDEYTLQILERVKSGCMTGLYKSKIPKEIIGKILTPMIDWSQWKEYLDTMDEINRHMKILDDIMRKKRGKKDVFDHSDIYTDIEETSEEEMNDYISKLDIPLNMPELKRLYEHYMEKNQYISKKYNEYIDMVHHQWRRMGLHIEMHHFKDVDINNLSWIRNDHTSLAVGDITSISFRYIHDYDLIYNVPTTIPPLDSHIQKYIISLKPYQDIISKYYNKYAFGGINSKDIKSMLCSDINELPDTLPLKYRMVKSCELYSLIFKSDRYNRIKRENILWSLYEIYQHLPISIRSDFVGLVHYISDITSLSNYINPAYGSYIYLYMND